MAANHNQLIKQAGFLNDIGSYAKDYFSAHIDKDKPAESVFNLLAPAGLLMIFRKTGFGKMGLLISFLMSVFHVDVAGIIENMLASCKTALANKGHITSQDIDQAANSSGTGELAATSSLQFFLLNADLTKYSQHSMRLVKNAGPISSSQLAAKRSTGTNVFITVLKMVFKIAFYAAGLMIAGDAAAHVLGLPSAADGSYQAGGGENARPLPKSTQTTFKFKSDSPIDGSYPLENTPDNIQVMMIQMAKNVYDGLDGYENQITNSQAFQIVKNHIEFYNSNHPNSPEITLPSMFSSQKKLVNTFMDDFVSHLSQ